MSIIKFTKLSWVTLDLDAKSLKFQMLEEVTVLKAAAFDVHMGKEYQFIFHRAQC